MRRILAIVILTIVCEATGLRAQSRTESADSVEADRMGKVYQLPTIVVSAARSETPRYQVASSITVISAEEIKVRQENLLVDLLRNLPGLDVIQQGGDGSFTQINIRGARANHTLVLIDGIEMSDPSSPNGAFDFASMPTDNIERIEILRGPQSVLYGSDAAGGVVRIITRKGSGRPEYHFSADAGSFNSLAGRIELRGSTSRTSYAASLFQQETDGISSAARNKGNSERDAFQSQAVSASLGIDLGRRFDLSTNLRIVDSRKENDQFDNFGSYRDDPNLVYNTNQLFLRSRLSHETESGKFRTNGSLAFTRHSRSLRDFPDANFAIATPPSDFDGDKLKVDLQEIYTVSRAFSLTMGLEAEEESFSGESYGALQPDVRARNSAVYFLSRQSLFSKIHTSVGIRQDEHVRFGSATTFRLTATGNIPSSPVTLRGTYGTGFRAPTLVQLFDNTYGNPDLDPERSRGWDAGAELSFFAGQGTIGLTWFTSEYDNIIGFDPTTFRSTNRGAANTSGIEGTLLYNFPRLSCRLDHTYTRTEDEETGQSFVRIPRNKSKAAFNFRPNDRFNVHLGAIYVGHREDINFELFARQTLPGYTVVDLALSYRLNGSVEIRGRIDNLFDEEYIEVISFGTSPVTVFLGLTTSW